MSAFGMLLQGKVGDAIIRVIETLTGKPLPAPLANLISKFTTDEGQVIWNAGTVAANDVLGGKSIETAADDALAILASQGITAARNDVLDAIGLQARA